MSETVLVIAFAGRPLKRAVAIVLGVFVGVALQPVLAQSPTPAPPIIKPGHPAFGLEAPPKHAASTPAQRHLGRMIFFDPRVSANRSMACGSCHVPEQGFTATATATAVGMGGHSLARNAPTVVNVAWQRHLFADGRERSLERLTWEPMLHQHEMGHASIAAALRHVRAEASYAARFAQAFPGRGLTRETFAHALAAYQRSLVAADSPFDQWRHGVDSPRMTATARDGFDLFVGKARCALCHTVEERHANFTDNGFHVIGAGRTPNARLGSAAIGDPRDVPQLVHDDADDLGRWHVSGKTADRRRFKTPSLRNVALTAPYMHDGSLATLADVIDFYDRAGGDVVGKSPMLSKLDLDANEKLALQAFLESLNSPHWDALVLEARRAHGSRDRPRRPNR